MCCAFEPAEAHLLFRRFFFVVQNASHGQDNWFDRFHLLWSQFDDSTCVQSLVLRVESALARLAYVWALACSLQARALAPRDPASGRAAVLPGADAVAGDAAARADQQRRRRGPAAQHAAALPQRGPRPGLGLPKGCVRTGPLPVARTLARPASLTSVLPCSIFVVFGAMQTGSCATSTTSWRCCCTAPPTRQRTWVRI